MLPLTVSLPTTTTGTYLPIRLTLHNIPYLLFTVHLNLRKKLIKCYIWSMALYGAETGRFGQQIRNTCKVLKCGAGEGWRRSVGPIM